MLGAMDMAVNERDRSCCQMGNDILTGEKMILEQPEQ